MRIVVLLLLGLHAPYVACDDLPAQQAPHDSVNVAKAFAESLKDQLRQAPFPPVIALVALVFGCVLLFNGLKSFEYTVTFACAITCGFLAKAAAASHFQHDDNASVISNIVWLEAALLVGAMAHIGHKGIMVFLGAAIGFFVAHLVSEFLVVNFHLEVMKQVEVEVVWYSICSLYGSRWMYTDRHGKILALLSPIPGGIFTASAIMYFATEAFVAFGCNHDDVKQMWQSQGAHCPNNLTPKVAPWIDFFLLGFSNMHSVTGDEDVGIFFNTTFNMKKGGWSAGDQQSQGYAILWDHILTLLLWVFLTLVGMKIQRCVSKRRDATERQRREKADSEAERRSYDTKQDKPKQEDKAKHPDAEKPASAASKSKWPFGGKKENGNTQLTEDLIEKGKGA